MHEPVKLFSDTYSNAAKVIIPLISNICKENRMYVDIEY